VLSRALTALLLLAVAAAVLGCGAGHPGALAQQASWGQGVFDVNCARCHAAGRTPGPLESERLVAAFTDAAALQRFVATRMPYDRPGILPAGDAWAVTTFLLERDRLLRLRSDHVLGPHTARRVRLGGDFPRGTGAAPP